MSLRIFISYIHNADYQYVIKLKNVLEQNYNYEVNLTPKRSELTITNSEKISKLIDASQIFISIMSEEALNYSKNISNWIHQELGYAYNHCKHSHLKIIVISDIKDNIRGFINPLTHDLSIRKGDPKMNGKEFIEAKDKNNTYRGVEIIKKNIKSRKDSIEQYTKGNRTDLADQEKAELEILEKYMPAQMGEDEVRKIVLDVISKSEAVSTSDFGRIMGAVMKEVGNKADGGLVGKVVKEELK